MHEVSSSRRVVRRGMVLPTQPERERLWGAGWTPSPCEAGWYLRADGSRRWWVLALYAGRD